MIFYDSGLTFKGLVIDAKKKVPVENLVITHAHSDHVCLSHKGRTFVTKPTLDLIRQRFGEIENPKIVGLKKRVSCNGFDFRFLDSGHVLGSVQVLIEGEKNVLVTSDFKVEDSLLLKGAKPVKCDVLVIESTYGRPDYVFPERKKVYLEMKAWCEKALGKGRLVVLSGYPVGKAQELTRFCNDFLGLSPLVHSSIFQANKVCEKHKVSVGKYILLDQNLFDSNVLIIPPTIAGKALFSALEYASSKKVVYAKASGFGNHANGKSFPLSDHASFPQLLEYTRKCSPEMVYTFHGFEEELAFNIRSKLGIPAKSVSKTVKGQSLLQEF